MHVKIMMYLIKKIFNVNKEAQWYIIKHSIVLQVYKFILNVPVTGNTRQ